MENRIILKGYIQTLKDNYQSLLEVLDISKVKNKIKELEEASLDASFWLDQKNAKSVIDEKNDLESKLSSLNSLKEIIDSLDFIYEMSLEEEDILNESDSLIDKFNKEYDILESKLLLSEKNDKLNAIIDIHSGAGGTESLDWVSMLFRMYSMFIQKKKYKMTILDYQAGDEVGIKSVTIRVEGMYAYGTLKSESGVHRLIRLSPFDSSHSRHTTFASVTVTPEVTDDIKIDINEADLRIDIFHSSGAGGQGVNTTDSAVRITHIPSKIVVTCQNERSQIQNKATALTVLKSKLYQIEEEKRKEEMDKLVDKAQISFGSQIRTYTFHPYTLVKDHRTGVESTQGDKVMDGDIDLFISEYLKLKGRI